MAPAFDGNLQSYFSSSLLPSSIPWVYVQMRLDSPMDDISGEHTHEHTQCFLKARSCMWLWDAPDAAASIICRQCLSIQHPVARIYMTKLRL